MLLLIVGCNNRKEVKEEPQPSFINEQKNSSFCNQTIDDIETELNITICTKLSSIIETCKNENFSEQICNQLVMELQTSLNGNFGVRIGRGTSMCPSGGLELTIYKPINDLQVGDVGAYLIEMCDKEKKLVAHRLIGVFRSENDLWVGSADGELARIGNQVFIFSGDDVRNQFELIPKKDVAGKAIWTYYFTDCGKPSNVCDSSKAMRVFSFRENIYDNTGVEKFVRELISTKCNNSSEMDIVKKNCFSP